MVRLYAANIANLPDPIEYPEFLKGLSDERKKKRFVIKYMTIENEV